jgi:hypothetical protein
MLGPGEGLWADRSGVSIAKRRGTDGRGLAISLVGHAKTRREQTEAWRGRQSLLERGLRG